MVFSDTRAVIAFLSWILRDIDTRNEIPHNPFSGNEDPSRRALADSIRRRIPSLEKIGERLGESRETWAQSTLDEFDGARKAIVRMIGILERSAEDDQMLGPTGPRIAAGSLHRWVWEAASRLWDDGHLRSAIQAAATRVENEVQAKLERWDVSGVSLWQQAFSLEPPQAADSTSSPAKPPRHRLRFRSCLEGTDRWNDTHQGALNFGVGCTQAIRNLVSHLVDEPEEEVALEELAALSVLARWADTAEIERAST